MFGNATPVINMYSLVILISTLVTRISTMIRIWSLVIHIFSLVIHILSQVINMYSLMIHIYVTSYSYFLMSENVTRFSLRSNLVCSARNKYKRIKWHGSEKHCWKLHQISRVRKQFACSRLLFCCCQRATLAYNCISANFSKTCCVQTNFSKLLHQPLHLAKINLTKRHHYQFSDDF